MQEEPNNESPSLDELEHLENAEPQKTLSRRKRGVAPVVGMTTLQARSLAVAGAPFTEL